MIRNSGRYSVPVSNPPSITEGSLGYEGVHGKTPPLHGNLLYGQLSSEWALRGDSVPTGESTKGLPTPGAASARSSPPLARVCIDEMISLC